MVLLIYIWTLCWKKLSNKFKKHCNILSLLKRGEDIIGERGFDIEDDLPVGFTLSTPTYLKEQFNPIYEVDTLRIASVCIHAEDEFKVQKSKNVVSNT